MLNPFKEIHKFQSDAGLIEDGYDDFLESSFQIEEALEGFQNNHTIGDIFGTTSSPKDISRAIVSKAQGKDTPSVQISDVDRLDKACDAIIYAIGSIAKLGLSPQDTQQALLIVNNHNRKKLGMPKDEAGKLIKPDGFVGPELELQRIIDKRSL